MDAESQGSGGTSPERKRKSQCSHSVKKPHTPKPETNPLPEVPVLKGDISDGGGDEDEAADEDDGGGDEDEHLDDALAELTKIEEQQKSKKPRVMGKAASTKKSKPGK